ncbi:MAG: hypothetical protein DME76_15760 [Verrucomicrobia bacterium]|nr:MAG: hypothetical protein DME76_15760 [Verrucomicrobiota bacterium]
MMAYDAPASLKAAYRRACHPNDGTIQKSLKKFDLAILQVLAAETAVLTRILQSRILLNG